MSKQIRQVVFLVVDSLPADTAYSVPMPFLDNHAVVFREAWSAGCWTLSSHAAKFTGTFPHQNRCDARSRKLAGGYPTLAELFRDASWSTHQLTANGVTTIKAWGLDRGFSHMYKAYDHMPSIGWADTLLLALGVPRLRKMVFGGNVIALESEKEASKVWLRDTHEDLMLQARAVLDVARETNTSSFVYMNLMEAHFPYHVADETTPWNLPFGKGTISSGFEKLSEINALYHLVNESWLKTDHMTISRDMLAVLKCRQQLAWQRLAAKVDAFVEELARHNDTLIVVCSDHGDAFGEDNTAYHAPNVTASGNRVPLWIIDPQLLPGYISTPVSTKDLFSTILRRAGLRPGGLDLVHSPEESLAICQAHYKEGSSAHHCHDQFAFVDKGTRYMWRNNLWHKAGVVPLGAIEPAWEPLPGIELLGDIRMDSALRRRELAQHFVEFKNFAQI